MLELLGAVGLARPRALHAPDLAVLGRVVLEPLAMLGQHPLDLGQVLGQQARLQVGGEDAQLALGRPPGPLGLREAVPRVGERDQARASSAAMGGQHRADAAVARGVGADDDVVGADAFEHRHARLDRQAVDGLPQVLDGVPLASHILRLPERVREATVARRRRQGNPCG
jgi:hypothetical protein